MAGVYAIRNISGMASNNLKTLRIRAGLTQQQVADEQGVSPAQISRWENGVNNVPSQRLRSMAEAYRAAVSELFGDAGDVVESGPKLPIKGEVAAGIWREAWEMDPDDWTTFTGRSDCDAPLSDRFGLRVTGDSMNEIYPHGTVLDCVAYDQVGKIESGKRVIVRRRRNGDEYEATVKEYRLDDKLVPWLVPRSNNPAFQRPIRMDEQDDGVDEVVILALVIGSYRPED